MALEAAIELLKKEFLIFQTLFVVLILIIVVNIILKTIKAKMLKKALTLQNSKLHISNIKFFFRVIQVVIALTIIAIAFFYHIGSWTGLGVFAGLITAALGFALQKPITGMAAWLIIMIRRPFNIGDRIKIGNVRGEVYDITLTHLYLDEIGGDIDTEDHSGRNVIVPNHLLFENPIINYTLIDEYVLGEIPIRITYESHLGRAMELIKESTQNCAGEHCLKDKREIKLRVSMEESCMLIKVRFYAPIKQIPKIKSDIATEIYRKIKEDPNVDIAYPHTEFVMKKDAENPLEKDKKKKKKGKQ